MAATRPDGTKVYYDLTTDPLYKPRCLKGEKCPRGNPTEGPSYDFTALSWDIVELYRTNQRESGNFLNQEQREDELLQRCFDVLHPLYEEAKANREEASNRHQFIDFAIALRGAR